MDMVKWVQILDKAICISYGTNTIGKGMNPIILLPAMVISWVDWLFNLGMANQLNSA